MATYPPPIENLPKFNSLVFTEGFEASLYSVASKETQVSTIPTGAITAYFGSTAPEGWLLCNGSEFNITEFKVLYHLLNSSYTPDLRGTFLRGSGTNSVYTNVAGQLISGQAIGSYSQDNVGKHYHLYNANQDDMTFELGTTSSGFGANNRLYYITKNGKDYSASYGGTNDVDMKIKTSLQTGDFSYIPNSANQVYPSVETYPPNYAINYIIKT